MAVRCCSVPLPLYFGYISVVRPLYVRYTRVTHPFYVWSRERGSALSKLVGKGGRPRTRKSRQRWQSCPPLGDHRRLPDFQGGPNRGTLPSPGGPQARLSRVDSVGARAKEPQRRDGRREKSEGEGAQTDWLSVSDQQVTESALAQRSSRLCGLAGFPSTAWSRLRSRSPAEVGGAPGSPNVIPGEAPVSVR